MKSSSPKDQFWMPNSKRFIVDIIICVRKSIARPEQLCDLVILEVL